MCGGAANDLADIKGREDGVCVHCKSSYLISIMGKLIGRHLTSTDTEEESNVDESSTSG
jgi:hypothetical protein